MSEASLRGAEGEEGDFCLRLMLSEWKVVSLSAAMADPLSYGGILGGI